MGAKDSVTTNANPKGRQLEAVGETGCSADGRSLFFEIVDAGHHRRGYFASFGLMSRLVLALHAALDMARARQAQRPGFDAGEVGARFGLRAAAAGLAVAPGVAPRVAVKLESDFGLPLHFVMSKDQAEAFAAALAEAAARAATMPTPPLS